MAHLANKDYQHRKATTHIVVHCSATKASAEDIGVAQIRHWHIKDRGWRDIGYHYVIRRNGEREMGRPTWAVGAHVEGHNSTSIGICLVGGLDESGKTMFNYTDAQMETLRQTITLLKLNGHNDAEVVGHTDFPGVDKDCPCFDVRSWWAPFQTQVDKEIKRQQCLR